jgi:hypothetical protein
MAMSAAKPDTDTIDWSLTTWEGARREQLRRWSALSLEEIILAQQEMQQLADRLSQPGDSSPAVTQGDIKPADASSALPLPAYSDEVLQPLSVQGLSELLIANEDGVPRNLIDECARRGDAMLHHLDGLLRDEEFWAEDIEQGEWWLRLHAAMILGLIPGERAGLLLAAWMRRVGEINDESLQDWLAAYWPALFRNKPGAVLPQIRALAQERSLDWYIRACALDAAVSMAQSGGEEALLEALAWTAGIAADESEDWDMRLCAGNRLLDFPRAAYRPLLEALVAEDGGPVSLLRKQDVEEAYSTTAQRPAWERFRDPWEFYSPAVIESRQERWKEEEARRSGDDLEDDELFAEEPVLPYVRETPKVGRNDPCPCGSGKKYKKCCLRA